MWIAWIYGKQVTEIGLLCYIFGFVQYMQSFMTLILKCLLDSRDNLFSFSFNVKLQSTTAFLWEVSTQILKFKFRL
jgi:hypothetical protein